MKEIRCGARFVLTREEYQRIPHDAQIDITRRRLSDLLAHAITGRSGFFTEGDWDRYGQKEFRAECYVLTPADFDELVDRIKRDIMSGMPPMLGGVSG